MITREENLLMRAEREKLQRLSRHMLTSIWFGLCLLYAAGVGEGEDTIPIRFWVREMFFSRVKVILALF